ncbi:MAG: hypothetical protein AAF578_13220 [Pseudomonadota bacterium]
MVAKEKKIISAETYEWVWVVREVNNKPDEKVPMEVGDYLSICVCAEGKAQFKQRSRKNRENAALWNGATGAYCAETGTLSGTLADKRTFKMTITQGKDRYVIRSEHRRNPDEGNWGGDDGWDTDPI